MPVPRTPLRRRPLLALLILVLLLVGGYVGRAVEGNHSANPQPAVSAAAGAVPLSGLPAQARQTVSLIQRHGPFPYSHDGIVYQNLERQLPIEPAGFYHEYTVQTPGSADRGTRRIVTGQDGRFYYTGDHYASLIQIDLTG
ncbi:MAG: ribonuclease domain-containing protein [Jatrophihabitans sp.]